MEILKLSKPGFNRSLQFVVEEKNNLGFGGVEDLSRIKGYLPGRPEHKLQLISKKPQTFVDIFGHLEIDYTGGQRFYRIWDCLREARIPVVPSMRLASDREVVMTDLSATGAVLYNKHDQMDIWRGVLGRRESPLDKKFIRLEFDEVYKQAHTVFQNASDQGIVLAEDDPLSLVLYPTGRWKLLSVDLNRTRFNILDAADRNNRSLDVFMYFLEEIKIHIQKTQTKRRSA